MRLASSSVSDLARFRFRPRIKPAQRKHLTMTYKIQGEFQAFNIGWMLGECAGATVTVLLQRS